MCRDMVLDNVMERSRKQCEAEGRARIKDGWQSVDILLSRRKWRRNREGSTGKGIES
jgi:hypothetical protein